MICLKVLLRRNGLAVVVMLITLATTLSPLAALAQSNVAKSDTSAVSWPKVAQTARPWTRWWWHGSAVDETNLTRLLEEYHDAGLGGVEITCIYGVRGNEARNREYLSDAWVDAVRHTISEANRLGLGVDLPAGSGWRMGGPSVSLDDANSKVVLEKQQIGGGESFSKQFGRTIPQAVVARDQSGKQLDLSDRIQGDRVEWQAPEGDWTVYSLAYRWAGDRVKRPGPGGAGLNINPFAKRSVSNFLEHFGATLERIPGIRAQFHDSFEYDGDWQPEFFDEFAARRGYRLEEFLPALAGDGDRDMVGRVKCDFRETLADMVLENLVEPWVAWAHDHGQLARNQSHGSPANWLDLYAACDIPETESFGRLHGDDADRLVLKFAASAAHVAGRRLVSAESATWLDEHFNVTLAQVKQIVDRQILAGVNHVFYHGTAYSPSDATWPGWLFYASTQLNPQNPIWRDLPALNAYITRCQSVLQESRPDNDVLLYWPLHDAWHAGDGLRMEIRVHNGHDWFYGQPLGDAAELLQEGGYAFDYVSDRGLASCRPSDRGSIQAPGGRYDAVVIPKTRRLPTATLMKLSELADAGATIIFWGELPESPPGMAGATPNADWKATIGQLREGVNSRQVFVTPDLNAALDDANVRSEQGLTARGIEFMRARWAEDIVYFLRNESEESVDDWISLASKFQTAALLDPYFGRIGLAQTRTDEAGHSAVRLQLAPGQSILVRVSEGEIEAQPWLYRVRSGEATDVAGPWQVKFIDGGPVLPAEFKSPRPKPWTEAPDKSAQNFAGTVRYSTTFDIPQGEVQRWLLDLGEVLGSARLRVNGAPAATRFAPPYVVELSGLQPTGNRLEVDVTGVAANRIRDLDRRGVEWRIFEDINLVNIDYKKFNASDWPVRPLGLAGPVTLTPLSSGDAVHRKPSSVPSP